MSKKLKHDFQIRLLLPRSWTTELDTLAGSRFITRLALIRFYLRTMMDKDLSSLAQHLEERELLRRAQEKARNNLDEWGR